MFFKLWWILPFVNLKWDAAWESATGADGIPGGGGHEDAVMSRIWGVAEDRGAGCRQGGASVMPRFAPAKW
ncbi:MAG: hypothetical protein LBP37_01350 [Spirochaetaceae bacterium]|jgi:hypothetical protein|nr:hypothetical protein [Spirochaetaceae bacterium]